MPRWHIEEGRKPTGGFLRRVRKKRKYEMGSVPLHTRVGKRKVVKVRSKGGKQKLKAASVEFVNVTDPKKGVTKRVKIVRVLENPANPHFVRMGIVTKGCIIETEIGKAKVISRPSQHGVVNAVLIKE
jgi:small subunit ribosomal protein S8e